MKYKHLTEHQSLYIFNRVICPQVEYKTQLTLFMESEFERMTSSFRTILKKQTHLVGKLPNYILYNSQCYNMKSLFDTQLEVQSSFLQQQLNNSSVLGTLSKIHCLQLQTSLWLPHSPLYTWKHSFNQFKFKNNLIATILSLMSDYEISIHPDKCNENLISGGSTPLYDILEKLYF